LSVSNPTGGEPAEAALPASAVAGAFQPAGDRQLEFLASAALFR
jgi:hypothetical protein